MAMEKKTGKKIDLIKFINECNTKYYKQLGTGKENKENFEANDVTELQMHKILYFLYGYFYKKYQKELFVPNFYAYKYGPVEKNYRKDKKEITTIAITKEEKSFLTELTNNLLSYSAYALVQRSHFTDPWLTNFNKDGEWKPIPNKEIQNYFLKN